MLLLFIQIIFCYTKYNFIITIQTIRKGIVMSMQNYSIEEVSWDCSDFELLCNELDDYLDEMIGGKEKREKFCRYNLANTMDYVLIAYHDNRPIGCCALRKYSSTEIELKRVYICPDYRKKNIAGLLLERLIEYATTNHYQKIVLETGELLKDSIHLYQRYGFIKTDSYGDYKDIPESYCMSRSLLLTS